MPAHKYEFDEPLQRNSRLNQLYYNARNYPDPIYRDIFSRQIEESANRLDEYLQSYAIEKADHVERSVDPPIYSMSFMALVVDYTVSNSPAGSKRQVAPGSLGTDSIARVRAQPRVPMPEIVNVEQHQAQRTFSLCTRSVSRNSMAIRASRLYTPVSRSSCASSAAELRSVSNSCANPSVLCTRSNEAPISHFLAAQNHVVDDALRQPVRPFLRHSVRNQDNRETPPRRLCPQRRQQLTHRHAPEASHPAAPPSADSLPSLIPAPLELSEQPLPALLPPAKPLQQQPATMAQVRRANTTDDSWQGRTNDCGPASRIASVPDASAIIRKYLDNNIRFFTAPY